LGCSFEFSQHPALFARVFTFGKAFGAHGAMVLGSEELINYLVNFARSFIYTTALPPEAYHRISEMVKKVINSDEIRNQLTQNIACWNSCFHGNNGPIQIVQGDSSHLLSIVKQGNKDGYALKAVLSPTVPKEKERLRICITTNQTKAEIEEFTQWLKKQMTK
jgi:8-amino-7-oxononanoate synthase